MVLGSTHVSGSISLEVNLEGISKFEHEEMKSFAIIKSSAVFVDKRIYGRPWCVPTSNYILYCTEEKYVRGIFEKQEPLGLKEDVLVRKAFIDGFSILQTFSLFHIIADHF